MEQSQIYSLCKNVNKWIPSPTPVAGVAWWNDALSTVAAQTKVKQFTCPSDFVDPNTLTFGVLIMYTGYPTSPTMATFGGWGFNLPFGASLGLTNYVGNAGGGMGLMGQPLWDQLAGPLYSQSKIRISDVANGDGTASTALIIETLGGQYIKNPRDSAPGWFSTGAMSLIYGMPETDVSGTAYLAPSSYHAGTVMFCFCDGSVKPLKKGDSATAAQGTYKYKLRQIGGYKDGRNDDVSEIVP